MTPYQRIWAKLLDNLEMDLRKPNRPVRRGCLLQRASAIEYVLSPEKTVGSFEFACSAIGRNATDHRQKLIAKFQIPVGGRHVLRTAAGSVSRSV
jgi:hypothetical protein